MFARLLSSPITVRIATQCPSPYPLPASDPQAGRGRGPRSGRVRGSQPLHLQPIRFFRGAAEQRRLLVGGATGGDPLEGVPHHRVAAHALVDREITLEHRALWAEGVNAVLDIRPPSLFEILRGGRHIVLEEGEAGELHAQPPDL